MDGFPDRLLQAVLVHFAGMVQRVEIVRRVDGAETRSVVVISQPDPERGGA
jgi:alpha/beta superfamily hydrolase